MWGRFVLSEKQKAGKEIKTGLAEKEPKIAIDHTLVPKHEILLHDEAKALLDKLKVRYEQLPKIFTTDPAIQHLNPKIGEIIKVTRNSATAGTATYYRLVIESELSAGQSDAEV